jgi:hypothetical protein
MRFLVRLSGLLLLAGCHVGPALSHFGPAGGHFSLRTSAATVQGELLAATDSSLIVFEGQRVTEVRYISLTSASIRPDGPRLHPGAVPSRADLARLRSLSRFPQGLSPELLKRFREENQIAAEVRRL